MSSEGGDDMWQAAAVGRDAMVSTARHDAKVIRPAVIVLVDDHVDGR